MYPTWWISAAPTASSVFSIIPSHARLEMYFQIMCIWNNEDTTPSVISLFIYKLNRGIIFTLKNYCHIRLMSTSWNYFYIEELLLHSSFEILWVSIEDSIPMSNHESYRRLCRSPTHLPLSSTMDLGACPPQLDHLRISAKRKGLQHRQHSCME